MKRETLKHRFRNRVPTFGAWTSLAHPSIAEIFASTGVHFVGIDMEHSTISQAQAQRIIAASQAAGVACLPRTASLDESEIHRLLDSGADGIIVPNVSRPEEVARIISAVKYPPVGARSYGVARAHGYGFDFESYTAAWNEHSVILIQIETIRAVEKAQKLLSFEEIDGVMIGPYDISGSLGIPGQLAHCHVTQACAQVLAVCKKIHKACGTQIVDPNEENLRSAFESGYDFVVLASDVFILWKWGEKIQSLMKTVLPRETKHLVKVPG